MEAVPGLNLNYKNWGGGTKRTVSVRVVNSCITPSFPSSFKARHTVLGGGLASKVHRALFQMASTHDRKGTAECKAFAYVYYDPNFLFDLHI